MIDEPQEDLAIGYLFGHLEGDARREFEAWQQSDRELTALVDDLREAIAAVALSAPQHRPRPQVRDRVLAITRGETAVAAPPAARKTGWISWAIAAGLAIAAIVTFADRGRWRREAMNARAQIAGALAGNQSAHDQAGKLIGELQLATVQAKTHLDQIAELRDEIVKLRGRDALSQVHIALLSAQVAEFAKAGVIIVWDPAEQRGVVRIANLPKAEQGKDYQLWVIDPQYPAPVNGGILTVADAGATKVSFKPDQLIEHADKFAISVEKTGGVPKAEGPIIFIGE